MTARLRPQALLDQVVRFAALHAGPLAGVLITVLTLLLGDAPVDRALARLEAHLGLRGPGPRNAAAAQRRFARQAWPRRPRDHASASSKDHTIARPPIADATEAAPVAHAPQRAVAPTALGPP